VLIGNGGAEYGVRGYITAYEVETGEQAWRFYTVPGDPSKPFEHKDLEAAAKTWGGEWWKYGGGGTVWDAMAYDPELGLLYIGTGNGSPWDRNFRSPGGGDNLYLSSIVALKASTGEYVWHYQTTPGEQWDFTATQHIILADLTIKGEKRKLLMQAPKNGFFYVLDRTNGKFISGDAFVYVNWAKGIDSLTGRPIENDFARYEKVNTDIAPIYSGGHNWQSMAFNHKTGLVYIPARDNVTMYGRDLDWVYNKKGYGTGNGQNFATGFNPKVPTRTDSVARKIAPRGFLLAWDPLKRKEVWRVPQKADWNGGVVTTAANLVFEGDAAGDLKAFDATNGKELWKANLGGGIIAPPITYLMDGKQYVSIAVGWGGAFGLKQKIAPMQGGRIFTFGLDGKAPYPTFEKAKEQKLIDVPFSATKDQIAHGQGLFLQYCDMCHAAAGKGGGGVIPDLGYSSKETHASIMQIVREGAYLPLGMPKFGDRLSEKDVKDIQYFIFNSAKQLRAEKNKK
jgi:quinohemoprotein ethanol dehydrogenase